MKTVICWIDDDRDYVDALFAYVRASDYRDRVTLKAYTSLEAFEARDEAQQRIHLLAAPAGLMDRLRAAERVDCFVAWRVDSPEAGACANVDVDAEVARPPHIAKFQPLQRLLAELLAISSLHAEGPASPATLTDGERTRIVSVYSATGAAGKTTVAANLAKLLGYCGRKTAYLNLERVSSAPMFPAEEAEMVYAQLLYRIKATPRRSAIQLEPFIRTDGATKADYVPPLVRAEEMDELTGGDVDALLDAIAGTGQYRYIVADLDSSLHPRIRSALARSDCIVWLLQDDLHCMHKTKRLLEELGRSGQEESYRVRRGRIRFIINKFTGIAVHDPAEIEIAADGCLPYIPEWKSVRSVGQLMDNALFDDALRQTVYRLLEGKGEDAVGR